MKTKNLCKSRDLSKRFHL